MKRFSVFLTLIVVLISSSVLAFAIIYNGGNGDEDMPTTSGSCSDGLGCHDGNVSSNGTVTVTAVADDGTWNTTGEPGTITATVNIDAANSNDDIVGTMIISSAGDNIKDDGWAITQDPNGNGTPYNYNERSGVIGDLVLTWDVNAPSNTGTYYVKARILFDDSGSEYNESTVQEITISSVAVDESESAVKHVALLNNYPNPFSTETAISYQLPAKSQATLRIYNVSGRLVRTLVDAQSQPAGSYTVRWDGTDNHGQELPHGSYLCNFTAGSITTTKEIVFLK